MEERAPRRAAGAADGRTTAVIGVTTAAAAHTRHTAPAHASVRDRPRPPQPACDRRPRRRGDQPHSPPSARLLVFPPWPPWLPSAPTSPARTAAPDTPPRRRPHRPSRTIWRGARRRRPPARRGGGRVDGGPARRGAIPLLAPVIFSRGMSSAAVQSGEGRRQRHRRLCCGGCRCRRARHRCDCDGWWLRRRWRRRRAVVHVPAVAAAAAEGRVHRGRRAGQGRRRSVRRRASCVGGGSAQRPRPWRPGRVRRRAGGGGRGRQCGGAGRRRRQP